MVTRHSVPRWVSDKDFTRLSQRLMSATQNILILKSLIVIMQWQIVSNPSFLGLQSISPVHVFWFYQGNNPHCNFSCSITKSFVPGVFSKILQQVNVVNSFSFVTKLNVPIFVPSVVGWLVEYWCYLLPYCHRTATLQAIRWKTKQGHHVSV